jgi:hypothetical protein
MAFQGNPKEFARDVSTGFFVFNKNTVRRFSPSELKLLHQSMELVARDIRGEQIPLEDIRAIQARSVKLQRLTSAILFIRNWARRHRIPMT